MTNRIEKGFGEYRELLELIGLNQVVSLLAAPIYQREGELKGVLVGYVEMKEYVYPMRFWLEKKDWNILDFVSEQLAYVLE